MNRSEMVGARLIDDPDPDKQLVGRYAQAEAILESACTWEAVKVECPYCHGWLRVRTPLLIGRIVHVDARGTMTIDKTPPELYVLECRRCSEKFTTYMENIPVNA